MKGDGRRLIIFVFGAILSGWPAVLSSAEPISPEVKAFRAEREAQRAALDRIRQKVEALQAAESRGPESANRTRLHAEAEARKEREAREAEAQQRETERPYAKVLKEIEDTRFWLNVRIGARAALPWLAALYGVCFLFLPLSPYRLYIDFWLTHSGIKGHPVLFGGSALCVAGVGWMLSQGEVNANPEMALALGVLGLFFWFFLPGFLWFCLVFLHSLVVPHPMEATFKRVLRGEKLSREEAANLAAAMDNAKRDGLPADWRVRSHIRRLERLAKLMEQEKAFLDLMSESILHQQRGERGK